jgi:peptidyl-prolyl cis-trans isomerase SurA
MSRTATRGRRSVLDARFIREVLGLGGLSHGREELRLLSRRVAGAWLVVLCVFVLGTAACAPKTVATVNGERIRKDDFDIRVAAAQVEYENYGIELTEETLTAIKDEVLEQLIDELLLTQAAKQAGVAVATAEIDEYYAEMAASYASEAEFLAAAKENGFTQVSLREAISDVLLILNYQKQYIDENVDPASIAVTEAEMRELYASYAETIEDLPPFEEVAELLAQELRDQKITDLGIMDTLMDGLRAAATIERTL